MATTTLRTRERRTFLKAATRLASGILSRIAAGVSRQAINRRVLSQLSSMSERELKDIGLVRQDVADASLLSGIGDASLFLVARRDERRAGRRAR